MAISYQLANSANWRKRWSVTKNAPPPPQDKKSLYSDPRYRIADFFCSIRLSSPVIAINNYSRTAKSHWKLAGNIIKVVDTGILLGNSLDTTEEVQRFWLNQTTLFFLKKTVSTYGLKFSIPYWVRDIRISVYEYTGTINDSIEQKLDQIKTSINLINTP